MKLVRSSHRLAALVTSTTALAVIFAACGEDSPEHATRANTTVTTGELTRSRFVAQIESFCRYSWNRALQRLADLRVEKGATTSEAALFAEASRNRLLPRIESQFDEIRNVGAPPGDEDEVETMVGTMQIAIERGEKLRITSPTQLALLFAPYNELALAYGLDGCVVREAFFGAARP